MSALRKEGALMTGNVPTAELGPIVAELITERWPHGGGIDVLAEKVGCDYASIENVIKQKRESVDFDLADKLLCALGRPDVWTGRLREVYLAVDLSWCKCAGPRCGRHFRQDTGGRLQRYCSASCRAHAHQVKVGTRTGEHLRSRGCCLRGHKLEGRNAIKQANGGTRCRACKQETDRAAWSRKKQRQLVTA